MTLTEDQFTNLLEKAQKAFDDKAALPYYEISTCYLPSQDKWYPVCTCGWIGETYIYRRNAEHMALKHSSNSHAVGAG